MTFDILAAIDLRGGKVVRLRQGDFAREDVYSDDLIEVGSRFADAGLRWLHVVDLDAARSGGSEHRDVIRDLLERLGPRLDLEVGGGVRDEETAGEILAAGARRVILGTVAVTDPQLVGRVVAEHGSDAVAVAIDVRAGLAYGRGWGAEGAGPPLEGTIQTLASLGVRTFEVTAIERDGFLEGPDLDLLERAVRLGAGDIIASGGITSITDLEAVRKLGCRGAIIGRALYEGRVSLEGAAAFAAAAAAQHDATDPGSDVLKGVTMNEPTR
jgi:phosphoribosylformimino-5-aminoimidazole carboxamide ribotide isomerase